MTEYTQLGYAADALADFVRWRKFYWTLRRIARRVIYWRSVPTIGW